MFCFSIYSNEFNYKALMYGFGVVTLCTSFVRNYAGLIAMRLLLGMSQGGVIPIIMCNLSVFFGPERLGKASAMSINLGSGLAKLSGLFAAAILAATNGSDLSPWHWLFIIESLPCFVLASVVLLVLPNNALACASFLSNDQHEWLINYTAELQEEKKKISSGLADQNVSFFQVLRDPRVILLSCASFFRDIGVRLWYNFLFGIFVIFFGSFSRPLSPLLRLAMFVLLWVKLWQIVDLIAV